MHAQSIFCAFKKLPIKTTNILNLVTEKTKNKINIEKKMKRKMENNECDNKLRKRQSTSSYDFQSTLSEKCNVHREKKKSLHAIK